MFNLQKSTCRNFQRYLILFPNPSQVKWGRGKSLRISNLYNGHKDITNKLDSRKLCLGFY